MSGWAGVVNTCRCSNLLLALRGVLSWRSLFKPHYMLEDVYMAFSVESGAFSPGLRQQVLHCHTAHKDVKGSPNKHLHYRISPPVMAGQLHHSQGLLWILQGTSVGRQCLRLVQCFATMVDVCFQMWAIDRDWVICARLVVLATIFSGEGHMRVQEGKSELWIGRLFHVVSHVTFHVKHVTSAPLCCVLFCWLFLLLGGGVWFAFWFCFPGELLLTSFWLSSSRDMTATVLSNAALEKKKRPECAQWHIDTDSIVLAYQVLSPTWQERFPVQSCSPVSKSCLVNNHGNMTVCTLRSKCREWLCSGITMRWWGSRWPIEHPAFADTLSLGQRPQSMSNSLSALSFVRLCKQVTNMLFDVLACSQKTPTCSSYFLPKNQVRHVAQLNHAKLQPCPITQKRQAKEKHTEKCPPERNQDLWVDPRLLSSKRQSRPAV